MPKLLSQEEVTNIAAKMTEAYGLPPPIIEENLATSGWNVYVEIYRLIEVSTVSKWLKTKGTKTTPIKVRDFYANDYEDALTKLEFELGRLKNRTNTAELFREKFALEEADAVLDRVLTDE